MLPGNAKFCSHCGQKRIHPGKESVWHLIVESVGDIFHFDSKFPSTIWPLIFRPGFLTCEYLEGRRVRYFEPFKLFLFVSFFYFLVSGLVSHKSPSIDYDKAYYMQKADSIIASRERGNYKVTMTDAYQKGIAIPDDSLRRMVKTYGLSRFVEMRYPEGSAVTKFLIKQTIKNRLKGSVRLDENMNKTIPKLVFFLIPFFALFLKLIYRKKRIVYFDHLIFSLHFLSFFFVFSTMKLMFVKLAWWINPLFLILLLIYLFLAIRRVYKQKLLAGIGSYLLLISGSLLMMALFYMIAATISFIMI
jgi:hypothetical protein